MRKLKSVLENINTTSAIKITKNALTTMTLADIENLLEEKDNLISAAAVELKALKEENEINYLKLQDINKRNVELASDLADEKRKSNREIGDSNKSNWIVFIITNFTFEFRLISSKVDIGDSA